MVSSPGNGTVREHGRVDLFDELDARGLVHDSTDRAELAALLGAGPLTLYLGIDPTGAHLHAGHLQGLVVLRRFQDAGHHVLAVVGGATGMVGDPSGVSDERQLLDAETVRSNVAAITAEVARFLGADGRAGHQVLDNATWTESVSFLDFLRDVGKHVSVNQMLTRESVRSRLAGESGISFTEFSYMLLQAHDFLALHGGHGCRLQVGGSDQWGNIAAGIDLVRRRTGERVHGLTWPLLTLSDGRKMGKTADGALWLDPTRTSPYRFHQFWVQVGDDDVVALLRRLTFLTLDEIAEIAADHAEAPEARRAQHRLADELTTMVHGPEATAAAAAAGAILFGAPFDVLEPEAIAGLQGEVDTLTLEVAGLEPDGIGLVDLLVDAGLASSRSDARRAIAQGGIYVDNRRVTDDESRVRTGSLGPHGALLLRRGKRDHRLVVIGRSPR